ncbi:MAG: tRNA glutamyl-Q(34) synthetase GluQRS [Betaproteobacteria bacterium]
MPATAFAYTGRFAPSPTGPLHAGSLVAALASWLDARAWNGGSGGRWLVRIEDLDTTRCIAGAVATILRQLQDCHLVPDKEPVFQSRRRDRYAQALAQLVTMGRAYPCSCSRKDIEAALQTRGTTRSRHGERVYPGTCRNGPNGKPALSWRFRVGPGATSAWVGWTDRRLGLLRQDVAADVGDFVLQRADGPFAYQLAVVVDDGAQQVSDVVRGADLTDNTARQMLLQQALGLSTPRYLHTPLVLGRDGHKLSKQNGALAVDTCNPLQALAAAAACLGLPAHPGPVAEALTTWVAAWRALYNPGQ